MAESKKKRSAAVRTRVVTADDPVTPAKKAKTTKKSTSTKPVEAKKSATKSSPLAKKVEERKKQKMANKKAKKDDVGYFKGAWYELKQVRWPDRKATWGMTVAVIIFTAFFVLLVLLLDAAFKYLFDLIIK